MKILPPSGSRNRSCTTYMVFCVALAWFAGAACTPEKSVDPSANKAGLTKEEESLLTAYGILADTLNGEASLKWLLVFKNVTLQGPAKEVKDMMSTIQKAATKRSVEMKKLLLLDPPVVGEPPHSAMGDAIQESAEEVGMVEMIFPDGKFNIRFLFLQAQATRMISIVAAQAEKFDPNPKRRKWLKELASEFEGYRDQLVDLAESCPSD